jgi:DEAD/DEAH box helicase domain-containing protein
VHGQLGLVEDWHAHRPAVSRWLSSSRAEIGEIAEALLQQAPPALVQEAESLVSYVTTSLSEDISRVVEESDMTHSSLSQLLAYRGLLPMFGFPTRVRHLFHQRPPSRAYPWPPRRGVVDRPLDIAITQFDPGSETVKDKAIHTAVGVAAFAPRGGRLVADPYPLGPPLQVGMCGACQALSTEQASAGTQACPVCGDGTEYQLLRLSEPRGFRTDFSEGRAFDGSFDWAPRASRARMSATAADEDWAKVREARIWSGRGPVYRVNDNDGRDFEFHRLADGSGWVVPEAYEGPSQPRLDASAGTDPRALASVTTTDVLLVGIDHDSVMPGLNVSPLTTNGRVSGRAAWFSFGFLMRSAAAAYLDVDPNELVVGLRTLGRRGKVDGEVFLSDSLENGAGYSTYIGRPEEFERFLRFVLNDYARFLYEHRLQGKVCDSACYACLKDYANMAYHGLLDWRLALDMAHLADGQEIGLSGYWNGLAESLVRQFCNDFDWDETSFGPLPGAEAEGRALIAVHPLWSTDPNYCVESLGEAIVDAEPRGYAGRWSAIDLIDLSRRPAWAESRIWQLSP